ncbi:MAG: response regulator [Verrucomicrobia bacterium]|nr:response regulator [Verrucomicrobiota bacterium]
MDGTTVLRALRAESSSLRLMATSGMPVTLPFHPLMNEEEVPFVLKPYDTPQLLHAVRSALLPEQSTPTLAP